MAVPIITQERLRGLFHFNAETGEFIRLISVSNNAKIGAIAGTVNNGGYVHIVASGRRYLAHRLAWLWMTGAWPILDIDHIDGNRSNNRFDNLRQATKKDNVQNLRKANKNNRSCGLLGVSRDRNLWMARIMINGTHKYLGLFNTPEKAHAKYIEAKRDLHKFCTI